MIVTTRPRRKYRLYRAKPTRKAAAWLKILVAIAITLCTACAVPFVLLAAPFVAIAGFFLCLAFALVTVYRML
ncbi:hypothetical protein TUMEXPCC7403_25240 [Tumidithrix helvetica PCC 7403]|uniref:hypothetical protein n=1 Tax=Tumidithrix helvetica TaxID=3457545 RepID=UPI003CBC3558